MVVLTFSVLDLFLQILFRKLIWHFDVIWLIPQQFTRRDLKPVAFLVLYKNVFNGVWEVFYRTHKDISIFFHFFCDKVLQNHGFFIEEDFSCYEVHKIIVVFPWRRPLKTQKFWWRLENQRFFGENYRKFVSSNNVLNCLVALNHGVKNSLSSLW